MPIQYPFPAVLIAVTDANQQFHIRWSGPPGEFQESTDLGSWRHSSLPVFSSQGTNEVVVSVSSTNVFFRVKR